MIWAFSKKIGAGSFVLLFALGLLTTQAETNSETMDGANQDANIERAIGASGKFLANTKIVSADASLVEMVARIQSTMKEIRRTSNDKGYGPQTIEEAASFLSRRINMACPPTKCFQYEDVFYFSGGTTAQPIMDFSSGLAIRKGETTIYEWMAPSSSAIEKSK